VRIRKENLQNKTFLIGLVSENAGSYEPNATLFLNLEGLYSYIGVTTHCKCTIVQRHFLAILKSLAWQSVPRAVECLAQIRTEDLVRQAR
jgi:hypothetical protein